MARVQGHLKEGRVYAASSSLRDGGLQESLRLQGAGEDASCPPGAMLHQPGVMEHSSCHLTQHPTFQEGRCGNHNLPSRDCPLSPHLDAGTHLYFGQGLYNQVCL